MPRKKARRSTGKTVVRSNSSKVPWDKWTFNAAWLISLVLAFGISFGQSWASFGTWSIILVIFGIVTGLVHSTRDVGPLMLVALSLVIFSGSSLSVIPYIGPFLSDIVTYFVSYLTPAALIIALRKLYGMFN